MVTRNQVKELFEAWISDVYNRGCKPYITALLGAKGVSAEQNGKPFDISSFSRDSDKQTITLNLGPDAISSLGYQFVDGSDGQPEYLHFTSRFAQKATAIYVPMDALIALTDATNSRTEISFQRDEAGVVTKVGMNAPEGTPEFTAKVNELFSVTAQQSPASSSGEKSFLAMPVATNGQYLTAIGNLLLAAHKYKRSSQVTVKLRGTHYTFSGEPKSTVCKIHSSAGNTFFELSEFSEDNGTDFFELTIMPDSGTVVFTCEEQDLYDLEVTLEQVVIAGDRLPAFGESPGEFMILDDEDQIKDIWSDPAVVGDWAGLGIGRAPAEGLPERKAKNEAEVIQFPQSSVKESTGTGGAQVISMQDFRNRKANK